MDINCNIECGTEEWRGVPLYEGLYQVSNIGRVKSLSHIVKSAHNSQRVSVGKILKHDIRNDYHRVSLAMNGKVKRFFVHQLVAKAFIPNPRDLKIINHKNGIHDDNRVQNLEWSTFSENNMHSFRVLGRNPSKTNLGRYGAMSYGSRAIIQMDDLNNEIKRFGTIKEASEETGAHKSAIIECAKGKRKHAGKFKWKYV